MFGMLRALLTSSLCFFVLMSLRDKRFCSTQQWPMASLVKFSCSIKGLRFLSWTLAVMMTMMLYDYEAVMTFAMLANRDVGIVSDLPESNR